MTSTVAQHYDRHLARIYSWMAGDFEMATAAAADELRAAGVVLRRGDLVVDLGCGPGAHAVAAGRAGATVVAVDGCDALLAELRERSAGLDVRPVRVGLENFLRHVDAPASAVLCMGDTLTHLGSEVEVAGVLRDASAALKPGGTFVATFRDYSGPPPIGPDRFLLVRGDDDRILTCCLEYGEAAVTVTDLIHERLDKSWRLQSSSYAKLRLAPARVVGLLEGFGLRAELGPGTRGMVRVVGSRP